MQRCQQDALEWLEFDLLKECPRVQHAVFLRCGGFSEGSFASLNTGFFVGDNPHHVESNFKRLEKHFKGIIPDWKRYVFGRGCHKTALAHVNNHSPQEYVHYDGLITRTPCITLIMEHADCQIALIYDPIHHVAATIHSGWRGSVANIYEKAIKTMHMNYGSNPADLLVCISPSLGPDKAEFINYQTELPASFWPFQLRPYYFDFWAISEEQLKQAGILPQHIEVARLCTHTHSQDFFSYRRDHTTGRHASCITLIS